MCACVFVREREIVREEKRERETEEERETLMCRPFDLVQGKLLKKRNCK